MTARGRLAWVGLTVALAGVLGAWWLWGTLHRPPAGSTGAHRVVIVPRGTSAAGMLDALARAGVVERPRLLRAYVTLTGGAGSLKAGEYLFDRPLSPLEVLGKLQDGAVVLHTVTVPEGLACREVAHRLAAAGLGPRAEFLRLFADPTPILDLDPRATDLEGYVFPDTYAFPRGESPARIVATMVERFEEVVGGRLRQEMAAAGMDVREAVTLASLIEKETGVSQERARISRVFRNRLERGMPLQCDPTVLYALERAGHRVGLLSLRDLQFDSPWNTYVHPGLPPSPICNPGLPSLEATAHPAPGDDLYFVAAPGGGHVFSSNIASHHAAVRSWRAYVRSSR